VSSFHPNFFAQNLIHSLDIFVYMVGVIVSFITTSKISFVAFGFKFSDFIHWAFIT